MDDHDGQTAVLGRVERLLVLSVELALLLLGDLQPIALLGPQLVGRPLSNPLRRQETALGVAVHTIDIA
ncbi:hypothetical protein [Prescottella agglutinans]|uniref:Uncharacterized protein n=1 Tax=Prescottella agglutinans TaxID=1644129 RepID=A0ABT6MKI3_9NOCA|nr:hypothetical protein [Prescottella agglutinans]MDH6284837.1 hypothetical protein [Prescottella agglutinans]